MSDIVETLRAAANHPRNDHGPSNWLAEAADEITALRAENEKLRAKIEHLSAEVNYAKYGNPDFAWSLHETQMNDLRLENERLRAALELYREAVRIDATMEGPKFMGSNASALKRAWGADLAALGGKDE